MEVGDYVKIRVQEDWYTSLQAEINAHPTGIFRIKSASSSSNSLFHLSNISGESNGEIFKHYYTDEELELVDNPFDPSGLHQMLEEL